MANKSSVSIFEEDAVWAIEHRGTNKDRTAVESNRNGSHLKTMFLEALALDHEDDAKALMAGIETLTAKSESGFSAANRHVVNIERTQDNKFSTKVQVTDGNGKQQETGDYERANADTIQEAYANVALAMGAPNFAADITALVL